jgi:hypothetical protein
VNTAGYNPEIVDSGGCGMKHFAAGDQEGYDPAVAGAEEPVGDFRRLSGLVGNGRHSVGPPHFTRPVDAGGGVNGIPDLARQLEGRDLPSAERTKP